MSEETRMDRMEAVLAGLLNVEGKPGEGNADEEGFECEACGTSVSKGQKHCSGCGKPLVWGE